MKILIDQAGFINKGAELMFCSVVERLQKQYPNAQLAIQEREINKGGYDYCQYNNIKSMRYGFQAKLLLLLYKICIRFKLMSPNSSRLFIHSSEIDVIIDAGGFRFGDQWKITAKGNKALKKYYKSFSNKCKLILLPQSFGPFTNKESIKSIKTMLKYANLIYSRETESTQHLKKIAPQNDKIKFTRDFTLLHKYDTFISEFMPKGKYVVIIPNKKMITHSILEDGVYLNFLCQIVEELHNSGENILLLNHEGAGDKHICQEINNLLNLQLPIVSDVQAMVVKNIIGNAKLLVSSRFHGVVSGIVQQVPTFCTSWSHKYNELVETYDLNNNLLNMNSIEDSIEKLKCALVTPKQYITTKDTINREKDSIENMWSDIFSYIDNRNN